MYWLNGGVEKDMTFSCVVNLFLACNRIKHLFPLPGLADGLHTSLTGYIFFLFFQDVWPLTSGTHVCSRFRFHIATVHSDQPEAVDQRSKRSIGMQQRVFSRSAAEGEICQTITSLTQRQPAATTTTPERIKVPSSAYTKSTPCSNTLISDFN